MLIIVIIHHHRVIQSLVLLFSVFLSQIAILNHDHSSDSTPKLLNNIDDGDTGPEIFIYLSAVRLDFQYILKLPKWLWGTVGFENYWCRDISFASWHLSHLVISNKEKCMGHWKGYSVKAEALLNWFYLVWRILLKETKWF